MKALLTRLLILTLIAGGIYAFHESRQHREPRYVAAGKKKILLLGNGAEVETLDPHLANGHPEHFVITALMEGLVAPAAENPDDNAPGAAASWENTDFTVWTFHLHPQGKWSDGTPLTAQDFIYAYQRILSPELASDYGQMLYPLVNAEAYNSGKLKDFTQVGVKALDSLTLQLTLNGPAPYFPGMLKHYSWFPIPRHVIEKNGGMLFRDTQWFKPGKHVGNGAFKLKAWAFTHKLEVERNPFYWDAATVKLNEIHFLPIVSDSTEERAFQDGQLHATQSVPLSRVPYYKKDRAEFYSEDPLLACYFYRVNTTKPPFNNKLVRRALALAIDRESLIKNVLRAGQMPASALTPSNCTASYTPPNIAVFNIQEARRLLAEAGYPDGKGFPKFDILINTMEAHRTIAEAIQEMWKKNLNLPVGILNQDWSVYLDSQRKLDFSVCRAGWVGDYADPTTFLNLMRTTDGNNNTGWGNPRYDELMAKSALIADPTQRLTALKEAEALMLEEMPILPIYWYVHFYLIRPEVKNWKPSVMEHRCYKALDL